MSTGTMVEVDPGRRSSLRNPFKLWISSEPWLALVFMLSSFVLGVFWFVTLVTLLSVGGSMAFTLVGIPVLIGAYFLWTYGARFERLRIQTLLGVTIHDPYRPLPEGSIWERWKARMLDSHTWLDLFYLFLLFLLGIAQFVIAVVTITVAFTFVTVPAWYSAVDELQFGPNTGDQIDTLPEALVVALIGLPLLIALPYILVGVGRGHAWLARHLLGTDREAELTERVSQLTVSRSRAMDSSLDDLRRIERDLHDGAQQRLVKLSMDLGMAKEKMESDPEAARVLVAEAHEEAKRAMAEIRNLARGIHPAVLSDRGLDAAVSSLASRSPVPVTVEIDLDERLPDTVESSAYFIVAEALTNVARHSNASQAGVTMRRDADRLLIDIVDDGKGGADASQGTGLAGMADRAAALDGTLTIDSPAGGPTRIHVELPCFEGGHR